MLLAVDIGNSRIKFGFFQDDKVVLFVSVPTSDSELQRQVGDTIEEKLAQCGGAGEAIDACIVCSVVPNLTRRLQRMLRHRFKLHSLLFDHRARLGMRIGYDDPQELGADRLANAFAVRQLYGFPAIVVDLGTATKLDLVDAAGDYIGGAIAAGPETSIRELLRQAARLRGIPMPDCIRLSDKPKPIGTNTVDCLKAGFFYGTVGQMRQLIQIAKSRLGCFTCPVVGTGGLARFFADEADLFTHVDPYLTLHGLRLAFARMAEGWQR